MKKVVNIKIKDMIRNYNLINKSKYKRNKKTEIKPITIGYYNCLFLRM